MEVYTQRTIIIQAVNSFNITDVVLTFDKPKRKAINKMHYYGVY
jgi:hypothetical protein